MGTVVAGHKKELAQKSAVAVPSPRVVWFVALCTGLAFVWPLIFAAVFHGPSILIRSIGGDTYHYLAIARKAVVFHRYTYDGVRVTNGFHPLWEYTLRGAFVVLHLHTHEGQAIALMAMALCAATLGIVLASAAVVRLTGHAFLGLLMVPGLYYLGVGVFAQTQWSWSALDGMESALSLLFGGAFFFLLSRYMGAAAGSEFELVPACRALGLILPLIVLSRLDDFFLLPALIAGILLTDESLRDKVRAGSWIAVPTGAVVFCYLVYNRITVGAAMPLSGGTKAGFVGLSATYLTAAVHFAPLFDLRALLTKTPVDNQTYLANSFQEVEVVYSFLIAAFGALAVWRSMRRRPEFPVLFGLCVYILLKMTYNFLEVHFWLQDTWYYIFAILTLSVLGCMALGRAWGMLGRFPVARMGIGTIYVLLMLLTASQYYAYIVDRPADNRVIQFWQRKDEIRRQLVAHGVTGIINVDDGITAFLLDLPNMHGLAFATDVEAQRAFRQDHMLSVAYARGINTITGFGYLTTETAPASPDEVHHWVQRISIARPESKNFDFWLAYYDPVLKMPFVSFRPKGEAAAAKALP